MKPAQIQEAHHACKRLISLGSRKGRKARRKMTDGELMEEFRRVMTEMNSALDALSAAFRKK